MNSLTQALDDYRRLRRSLGFTLERHGRLLPRLVDHLNSAGAATLTTQLALDWATALDGKPDERAIRLSIARGFARYLQSLDPATEVPPADLLPRTRSRANPYLYTEEEVVALMEATRTLRFPISRATYNTVVGLLAATGMRIGELIALDRDDVDRAERTLLVRNAKFKDTRLLPLHASTAAALGDYADLRDTLWPEPKAPAFFVSTTGKRLLYENVYTTFQHLVRTAGLRPRSERCHPRPHDFRHRMIVVTLVDWYRQGADVAALLPALSTYVGHSCPAFTYWYVSAAPELLALAAARREQAVQRRHRR
jgi:integrase